MKKVAYIAASLNNYGSQLQTYALYQVMLRYNIIGDVFRYNASTWRKLLRLLNKDVIRRIFVKINRHSGNSSYMRYIHKITIRNSCFEKYKQNCGFFLPETKSRKQIKKKVKIYDGVILGSDQVWNPVNFHLDFYTLGFVPEDMMKITYASSFGVSKIPKKQITKTKKYLSRIQYISVREDAGSSIVYELTKRRVPVVCDPTALLTAQEWKNYSRPYKIINDKYILCYFLGENKEHREYAKKFAKTIGFKIVTIPHVEHYTPSDIGYADIEVYDADPKQFVSLIRNAEFVFTDSFHATMFSVYFHKTFFTFYRYSDADKKSANSRVVTALQRLGITSQLMTTDKADLDIVNSIIDWDSVENKLSQWREESLKYFDDALTMGGLINDKDK